MMNENCAQDNQVSSIITNDPNSSYFSQRGRGIAIKGNGLIMAVGDINFNEGQGCTRVYTRKTLNDQWIQKDTLIGTNSLDRAWQGYSLSFNDIANTLVIGCPGDQKGNGCFYVFKLINDTWTQQGDVGYSSATALCYGQEVYISRDGSTIAVGSPLENYANGLFASTNPIGATYIYIFQDDKWTIQARLVGEVVEGLKSYQGTSLSLSNNGDTLCIGGYRDTYTREASDVFIYRRLANVWKFEEHDLFFTAPGFGEISSVSVSLSGLGNVLAIGGYNSDKSVGCTWLFEYNGEISSLSPGHWVFKELFEHGRSDFLYLTKPVHMVKLSRDGKTLIINGLKDVAIPVIYFYRKVDGHYSSYGDPIEVDKKFQYLGGGVMMNYSGDGKTVIIVLQHLINKEPVIYPITLKDETVPVWEVGKQVSR